MALRLPRSACRLAEQLVDDEVFTYLKAFYAEQAFESRRDAVPDAASASTPLAMPVLVITGQRDAVPGLDRVEFMAGAVRAVAKNVSAVDIRGAGHWLSEEQPEAVAQQILRFLSS